MNNASIQEPEELQPDTTEIQARLTRILEAILGLSQNPDWLTLQELHFSKEEERVNRLLLSEVSKSEIDLNGVYRLQGERIWAKRYADLRILARLLEKQLKNLKNG